MKTFKQYIKETENLEEYSNFASIMNLPFDDETKTKLNKYVFDQLLKELHKIKKNLHATSDKYALRAFKIAYNSGADDENKVKTYVEEIFWENVKRMVSTEQLNVNKL